MAQQEESASGLSRKLDLIITLMVKHLTKGISLTDALGFLNGCGLTDQELAAMLNVTPSGVRSTKFRLKKGAK